MRETGESDTGPSHSAGQINHCPGDGAWRCHGDRLSLVAAWLPERNPSAGLGATGRRDVTPVEGWDPSTPLRDVIKQKLLSQRF